MPSRVVNDAVDQVRRANTEVHNVLAGTRYLLAPQDPVNLLNADGGPRRKPPARRLPVPHMHTTSARVPGTLWPPTPDAATVFLEESGALATHSRLPPSSMPRALSSAAGTASCAPVPPPDSQWPHRGDQQPRPSRQSKGSRLPLSPQPQSHGLPARSQTQSHASKLSRCYPCQTAKNQKILTVRPGAVEHRRTMTNGKVCRYLSFVAIMSEICRSDPRQPTGVTPPCELRPKSSCLLPDIGLPVASASCGATGLV